MSNSTRPPSPAPPNSAPERRYDPVTGQSIIIAGSRHSRSQEFQSVADLPCAKSCAFCAGHEDETTPTVASYPPATDSTEKWQVRVVRNMYPSFVDDDSVGRDETLAHASPSVGQHDVIIESPLHRRYLTEMSSSEVQVIFEVYRDRYRTTRQNARYNYALLFKNSGRDAGTSREHIHSQFVALPIIPPIARLELHHAEQFYALKSQCVFCKLQGDMWRDRSRLVLDSEQIVAFAPFASRVPYEVWVMPKRHQARFEECTDGELRESASTVHEVIRRLQAAIGPTAFNYVIHTNPFDTSRQDHYHWHIEILPRTSRLAGLELGAGLMVNSVPPEVAATQLRNAANE